MEETVFTPAIEGMKHMKSDHGDILTKPFLDVCKMLLPILGQFLLSNVVTFKTSDQRGLLTLLWFTCLFLYLDKFGAAMAVVKSDISGNISVSYDTQCVRLSFIY